MIFEIWLFWLNLRATQKKGLFSNYFTDQNARKNEFKPTSDIYSLGLCLYYIKYGKCLYDEKDNKSYDQWLKNEKRDQHSGIMPNIIN